MRPLCNYRYQSFDAPNPEITNNQVHNVTLPQGLPTYSHLKRTVASAYQVLYLERVATDDTLGHLSARCAAGTTALVKPWGVGFDEVEPDNLLEMSIHDVTVCSGTGRLHSEMPLHCEIFKARADINCVIHIHPFFATLLTAVWDGQFRHISYNMQLFSEGIGFFDSSTLIRANKLGAAVAKELGTLHSVLLRNHGIVTVGASIAEAVIRAVELERMAKEHLLVAAHQQVETSSCAESERQWADPRFRYSYCSERFAYLCRRLTRMGEGTYCG